MGPLATDKNGRARNNLDTAAKTNQTIFQAFCISCSFVAIEEAPVAEKGRRQNSCQIRWSVTGWFALGEGLYMQAPSGR